MEEELLLEALYIFNKYFEVQKNINENKQIVKSELPNNISNATIRILKAANLLEHHDNKSYINQNQQDNINEISKTINENNLSEEFLNLTENLKQKETNPFFKDLNEIEYEIYARCNYPIAYNIGKEISNIIDFNNTLVLDIGGNSGGLATAIVTRYPSSNVTVVDKEVPCNIGEEYKQKNQINNINFIKQDFLELNSHEKYDNIILSNILHDYNDSDCKKIIQICKSHLKTNAKILVFEDVLDDDFNPYSVLIHGLRLSVNTIYGQQRTVKELNNLFKDVCIEMNRKIKINDHQSLVIYEFCKGNI